MYICGFRIDQLSHLDGVFVIKLKINLDANIFCAELYLKYGNLFFTTLTFFFFVISEHIV